MIYGITFFAGVRIFTEMSTAPKDNTGDNIVYQRLTTIFQKNKFGYHTQLYADFDNLLQTSLNEQMADKSSPYYDDPSACDEIQDVEEGLNGQQTEEDIFSLVQDKDDHHGNPKLVMQYPGRVGYNYERTDDLSIYKVHPRGVMNKIN